MKNYLTLLSALLLTATTFAQVGINTETPDGSAALDIVSTTGGILIPRLTESQRDLISTPATGLLIYQTNQIAGFYFYNGGSWTKLDGTSAEATAIFANNGTITSNVNGTYATDDFVFGAAQLYNIDGTDDDKRLFFDKSKAAFRAGYANDTKWDEDNIGSFSTAMGNNTTASGNNSTAMGNNTTASGWGSTTMGWSTTASGNQSIATGEDTTASGEDSTAMGFGTTASAFSSTAMGYSTAAIGDATTAMGSETTASGFSSTAMGGGTIASGNFSAAMGHGTTAPSYGETSIGIFNTEYTPNSTTTFNATDRLFTIGNGEFGTQSNALTILKNGTMNINDAYNMPTADGTNGQVLTTDGAGDATWATAGGEFQSIAGVVQNTTAIATDDFVFGAAQLNNIDGTDDDRRLFFDKDKAAFRAGYAVGTEWDEDNIGTGSTAIGYRTTASGLGSTAMGFNTIASATQSTAIGVSATASGSFSTAMGSNTTASGTSSMAMGNNTTASGGKSTAMGNNTTASGDSSTAMGFGTTASEIGSTAMGNNTTASGRFATAMGNRTVASGRSSVAMGAGTIAPSYGETAIGIYNTTYTPTNSIDWHATDRLFVIGNGTFSSQSNAMVVLKNGNVGIGTSSPNKAKLEVSGSVSNTVTGYGFLTASGTLGNNSGTSTQNFSIWASSRVAGSTIWAHSDKRIKTNIETTDNESDLEKLMEFRIRDYEFKDKAKDGFGTQKKVIAQEVKEIYPSAVDANNTKVIPDIMEFAAMDANWVQLKGHDLKQGDKVRLVHATGSEDFIVQEIKNNSFKVDFSSQEDILVYGREVNDFHVVDYDALTTLNISATQAQQKTIETQAAEIEALKANNATIKTQFNSLKAEVSEIKALLNQSNVESNDI